MNKLRCIIAIELVVLLLLVLVLSGYRSEPVCYKVNGAPMSCDVYWAQRNR